MHEGGPRIKRLVGALLLSASLILGGCARGTSDSQGSADGEVTVEQVKHGVPEVDGWVDDAVEFCRKNDDKSGVLVRVTGMITKGYHTETVSSFTIVNPLHLEDSGRGNPLAEVEIPEDAPVADVYLAEPVNATKWRHLTSVQGMAYLDGENSNKIVIRTAVEVD